MAQATSGYMNLGALQNFVEMAATFCSKIIDKILMRIKRKFDFNVLIQTVNKRKIVWQRAKF